VRYKTPHYICSGEVRAQAKRAETGEIPALKSFLNRTALLQHSAESCRLLRRSHADRCSGHSIDRRSPGVSDEFNVSVHEQHITPAGYVVEEVR